jgi:hypothetical protein
MCPIRGTAIACKFCYHVIGASASSRCRQPSSNFNSRVLWTAGQALVARDVHIVYWGPGTASDGARFRQHPQSAFCSTSP